MNKSGEIILHSLCFVKIKWGSKVTVKCLLVIIITNALCNHHHHGQSSSLFHEHLSGPTTYYILLLEGFPGGSVVKNPPANAGGKG